MRLPCLVLWIHPNWCSTVTLSCFDHVESVLILAERHYFELWRVPQYVVGYSRYIYVNLCVEYISKPKFMLWIYSWMHSLFLNIYSSSSPLVHVLIIQVGFWFIFNLIFCVIVDWMATFYIGSTSFCSNIFQSIRRWGKLYLFSHSLKTSMTEFLTGFQTGNSADWTRSLRSSGGGA